MKKLLYCTTALVAAGALASGSAVGAAKIKMGVGGYMQAFFVGLDQDDSAGEPGRFLRDHLVAREGEIIFNGTTTFDNGLKVGAQVQLEAETCGDQIDEGFIFFSGSWGRINIGSENSAAYLMHYSAPAPSRRAHGLQSSNFLHAGPGAGHAVGNYVHTAPASLSSDSEKITYFTPRLSGFQFGVSYSPERCEENNPGAGGCGGSKTQKADVSQGQYYSQDDFAMLPDSRKNEYCRDLQSEFDESHAEFEREQQEIANAKAQTASIRQQIIPLEQEVLRLEAEIRTLNDQVAEVKALPTMWRVNEGESLSLIASNEKVYNDIDKWWKIFEANQHIIHDPYYIFPDSVLVIPRDWPIH